MTNAVPARPMTRVGHTVCLSGCADRGQAIAPRYSAPCVIAEIDAVDRVRELLRECSRE